MSRLTRHQIATTPPDVDLARPGNMCKFPAGQYGKRIAVADDGTITIDKKAYVDDVVAFAFGSIRSNPTIHESVKLHLARFVDAMDARADERHGYSHSETERDFTWTRVANE